MIVEAAVPGIARHPVARNSPRASDHTRAESDTYAFTALVAAEAARLLAGLGEDLPAGGGVLTPAVGLGMPLVEALGAAGLVFDVESGTGARPS